MASATIELNAQRRTAVLACLSYAVSMSDRLIMSVAVVPMAAEFGWDLHTRGSVLSSFGWGYIATQVLGGILARRWGSKPVLCLAVSVWSFATLAIPPVARLGPGLMWVLFSVRILLGLGEGLALPAVYHTLGQLRSGRSSWLAMLYACGSAGHLLALLVCPLLSWSWMFFSFGSVGLLWVALWSLYAVDEPSAGVSSSDAAVVPPAGWATYMRCRPLLAIVAAHLSSNCCVWFLSLWLPTYLNVVFNVEKGHLGISALPNLANVMAGPLVGWLNDAYLSKRTDLSTASLRRGMTNVGLWGQSAAFAAAGMAPGAWSCIFLLSIGAACKTFACGGWESSHGDIAPTNSGTTYGISNTIATLPAVLLGPLVARVLEATDGAWALVFFMIACAPILGSAAYARWMGVHPVL